jgi:predicted MFS family arabinose efflux permease
VLETGPEAAAPVGAHHTGSYRSLLRRSDVRWQALSGLLAQVTQGASAVGIILVIRGHMGSLALAGGTVGVSAVAVAISRPLQGRIIDRRGSRGVMAACGIGHALALGGIVGLSALHAPGATLIALGCLTGLTLPPVSTTMRVEWGKLVGQDRTPAYSLVYLTQELAILIGPLILAGVIAAASASLALVVIGALTAIGALGFSASSGPPDPQRGPSSRSPARVLRVRAIQLVLAMAFLVGAVIGAIDVAVPALATERGSPAAAGLLIACLSMGGIVGAAVYGTRRWGPGPARRLLALLGLMTVAIGITIAAGSLVVAGLLLFLAGIPLNPALTTFSLLIDGNVATNAAAEAFGWLSTALAGGTGAASAIAAAAVQHEHTAQAAFIVAAIASAGAVVVSLLGATLARAPAS